MPKNIYLKAFLKNVAKKYEVLNSLFLTLPFENLLKVGTELPEFTAFCRLELQKGTPPQAIVQKFFRSIVPVKSFSTQTKILILMLQFVERQVVLFDALEDAAFSEIHDIQGDGTLIDLLGDLGNANKKGKLLQILKEYKTRIVLTAHPTQFYPPTVLGVIHDLTEAIRQKNVPKIRDFLLQLGKTAFKNRQRLTPLDEADSLIDYLIRIFYPVLKKMHYQLFQVISPQVNFCSLSSIIELGFWPGGDRDGNPNVTHSMTLQVADKLKSSILEIYIDEIKKLKRRLTFKNVLEKLEECQEKLETTLQEITLKKTANKKFYQNSLEFIHDLENIRQQTIQEHQSLFVDKVEKLLSAVVAFGFHFASLDLRQNSPIHSAVIAKILADEQYAGREEKDKIKLLLQAIKAPRPVINRRDPLITDVIGSLQAAQLIQTSNGEKGLHRYIISHTQSPSHILEVIVLAYWAGWPLKNMPLDIVPLFETIQDLEQAETIMRALYSIPLYRKHLKTRNNHQTIMLGFSDGTKDGGYVTANWEIYKAKKKLAALANSFDIEITFFDGRGGPPARGGGKTHQYYRAMENTIKQKQIQLTIQGQTISSNYGNQASATYNIEQLFTSGLYGRLLHDKKDKLSEKEAGLIESLSAISAEKYHQLKLHPLFLPYLENITPLEYYGELNIASRPVKRSSSKSLDFDNLRAIPFVGAWSQMKQNIPGFYGLGTALQKMSAQGQGKALKKLYKESLFIRTLFGNSMQSLVKSYFPLTHYLSADPEFGEFWKLLDDEARLTIRMLKEISGQKELLEDDPVVAESIKLREELVLPLLVIQQYALMSLRQLERLKKAKVTPRDKEKKLTFRNLVLKSLAANINASRNSA